MRRNCSLSGLNPRAPPPAWTECSSRVGRVRSTRTTWIDQGPSSNRGLAYPTPGLSSSKSVGGTESRWQPVSHPRASIDASRYPIPWRRIRGPVDGADELITVRRHLMACPPNRANPVGPIPNRWRTRKAGGVNTRRPNRQPGSFTPIRARPSWVPVPEDRESGSRPDCRPNAQNRAARGSGRLAPT